MPAERHSELAVPVGGLDTRGIRLLQWLIAMREAGYAGGFPAALARCT